MIRNGSKQGPNGAFLELKVPKVCFETHGILDIFCHHLKAMLISELGQNKGQRVPSGAQGAQGLPQVTRDFQAIFHHWYQKWVKQGPNCAFLELRVPKVSCKTEGMLKIFIII